MSEGTIGLIVFFSLAVVSSLVWHRLVASYFSATIGAAITTVIAFQIAVFLHLGYLDPFFLVAVATSSIIAVVAALAIGLPFRTRRKTHPTNGNTF